MKLVRYRTLVRPRRLSPFRLVGGKWHTNSHVPYVRRVKGKPMVLQLSAAHGFTSLLTTDELAFVQRWAKRRGWIVEPRRADLDIPQYRFLAGDLDCNEDLLEALNRVGARLKKTIFIRSGRRTHEEQIALYERNMNAATDKPKPGRPLTARPNANAPHIRGVAADCGIDGFDIGDWPGAYDAMVAEGVGLPVPSEDWHCEITDNMAGARS